MSFPNIPPSDRATLAAAIDPQSATTAKTSDWVKMGQGGYDSIVATVKAGAFASGAKLDAEVQQAINSSGGSAKSITGKSITQLLEASANKQAQINVRATELDDENGFSYVALVVTPTVGAVLIDGQVEGFDAGEQPATAVASLAEVVS